MGEVHKTAVGDLFLIPIDDARRAPGQVVARYGTSELLYIAAFNHALESGFQPLRAEAISALPLLFVTNTFDALLGSGHWLTIGQVPPLLSRFPFPFYKVVCRGKYYLESWDGRTTRVATPSEVERHDFRGGVAPIRLENAVKAHFGTAPWHPSFEKLRVEYAMERSSA